MPRKVAYYGEVHFPSRERVVEILRFGVVGGLSWGLDTAVFNVARFLLGGAVIWAKVIAVAVAACFSWTINRGWTFKSRATDNPVQELVKFLVVNLLGMLPPLLCLWISHYMLGWTSTLADNISGNVIGLILGTVLRYFGYRYLVFNGNTETEPSEK
jgi:Predicted membrane protein